MQSNKRIINSLPKASAFLAANSLLVGVGLFIFICLVVFCLGAGLYGYANNTNGEAVERMSALSTTMAQEQVYYSEMDLNKISTYQGFVLAVEGMRAVSGDMIRGKFNNTYPNDVNCDPNTGLCEHKAGDPIPGDINANLVINALAEAYPDLTNQAIADLANKLIDTYRADQAKYANYQVKRLDEARSFQVWLNGGGGVGNREILRPWILRTFFNVPGDNPLLYVALGDRTVVGGNALVLMLTPVVSENTFEAYESGIQQPTIPEGNPFAPTTPMP